MLGDMIDPIRSFLDLGGPVVLILLLLSVFAVALIALKLFQFWREGVGARGRGERILRLWGHGRPDDAIRLAEGGRGALDAAMAAAIRLAARRSLPKEAIEDEVARIALGRLHELQRGFKALDAIAQIAPLLGLFGTVLGMIEAFQQLQAAGNSVDPSILAGGIWVALLTTAVGLAVAMPVSLCLTWFETRLEDERVAIETQTSRVFAGGASEAALEDVPTPAIASGGRSFAH